mgnify:FL=1
MSNHFGNLFASIPGSGFRSSTASGSNPFNKSRRGISSSNSSNKFMNLFGNPTTNERRRLLNDTIDKIIIGIEPIGTEIGHGISYYTRGLRINLPTYLGGGTFVHHLSCLITLKQTKETVILEFGAYYGGEEEYKNYIHYVYDAEKEGGLRFSKMSKSDYHSKIFNGKKGAIIIENVTIDNIMTFNELIEKCKSGTSWKANDYNLANHNCQDFIAKVIEVLKVKRTIDDETKYSHMSGKINYPPVILKALEKNDTPTGLTIAESIPYLGLYVEFGAFIYSKIKRKKNS